MKLLPAAAFLLTALLAPLAASAEDKDGDGVDDGAPAQEAAPAPGSEPKAGEPAPGGEAKYGSFALDAGGNKITGEALSKLPPEAQWAMKEKGYSPVLGPNGEVLGYDNGSMCILPHAVGEEFAASGAQAKMGTGGDGWLGPDVAGPCPPSNQNCHEERKGQAPPASETTGDIAGMIPPEPGKNHCDQPGPPPPCAPREQTPEEKAQEDRERADQNIAKNTEKGDVDGLAKAIDERRNLRDPNADVEGGSGNRTPAMGTNGTDIASNDPWSSMGTGGGQSLGQEGRVGGDASGRTGGGLAGREVAPDSRALAQSIVDMNRGMANGPMDGPSDPNVASVAQLSQRGLGGRAMDAARSLFSTLSENLGVAAATPETDLTDQMAINPIDGAATNRAAIRVCEKGAREYDSIGSDGKFVRKPC